MMSKFHPRLLALVMALALFIGIPSNALAQGLQWRVSAQHTEIEETSVQQETGKGRQELAMQQEEPPAERELLTDKSTEFGRIGMK